MRADNTDIALRRLGKILRFFGIQALKVTAFILKISVAALSSVEQTISQIVKRYEDEINNGGRGGRRQEKPEG
ncbi:MAG: hypothetical protein N3F07_01890 [Candidatus Micrarchaeota archaeon]|nr:hypothetical protein [Candidatus Micrarchaeota archaeon]